MIHLMFTPTDLFSMRIVLVIFLFLTVVGILNASAMLIYEFCRKTEKCNKKKGLIYVSEHLASCWKFEAKKGESEHPNSFILFPVLSI